MLGSLHWTAGIHHDGSALYVSNPLPTLNEVVQVWVRVPASAPIKRIFLRTAPDGENHLEAMKEVERDTHLAWWQADLPIKNPRNPYRFKILTDEGAYYLTGAGISRADGPDWNDFKLLADYTAPTWTSSAVFYQIFPDRFFNGDPSNDVPVGSWTRQGYTTSQRQWGEPPLHYKEAGTLDFYGGDLPGITQKIPYLQDLGVTALYLTPIFTAKTNHRYDIADYENIDQYLGGNEALAELRRGLDAAGMRIVLDVTLNHCGWFHPWFTAAQKDLNASTAEYFTFYQNDPEKYECWLGVRSLPKFNYRSEKLRDTLFCAPDSILRRWLKAPYRINGWRLDVHNMQGRQGSIQLDHKIGRQIRRAIKADMPEAYLLGEHFFDATTYLQGDEIDATMNYQGFTIPLWRWLAGHDHGQDWRPEIADTELLPGEYLAEQWTRYRASIPYALALHQFNLLDSHDTARILRKMGGDKSLVYLAATMLLTYVGTPCIYYGDEIGMDGGPDPDNRRTMIWDESQWDTDLRGHFQRLIKLRRTAPALINGGFQQLYASGGLLVYQRQSKEQRLIVVGYRGPEPLPETGIPVTHSGIREGATLRDLLSGATFTVTNGAVHISRLDKGASLILEEIR